MVVDDAKGGAAMIAKRLLGLGIVASFVAALLLVALNTEGLVQIVATALLIIAAVTVVGIGGAIGVSLLLTGEW